MITFPSRISEFAELEDQSHKLEILGRLAGGVAHDMNNALTVINGFSDLALARLLPNDPCHQLVAEVRKAGEHAADLTRQLLTFSRKQTVSPQMLDLNLVIAEMGMMLRRVISEDIELATHLQRDLFAIWTDIGRMEQLLMNLVVNARDAMPQGGRLSIATKNVEQNVWPYFQVALTITDTGVGMSDEVKARLFEPFFTTKTKGKGTGLGLATVYEIVQKADGRIEVESEPGRGATFRVYLPGIKSPSWPGRSRPDCMNNAPHGRETVLLVEDECGVRSLCKQVLQKQGYDVLEAESADEATQKCNELVGPIDLLVSDVVMPGFSGHHLAERLLQLRPHMRVLFISGYADDEIVQRGVVQANVNFLQKPFTPLALAQKVREVLDAKCAH